MASGSKALLVALAHATLSGAARLGLHAAAEQGQVAPLKAAIDGKFDPYEDEWKKPDINGRNKKGKVALHLAVCNKRGDLDAVSALLEKGADANALDVKDETALHVVARMCDHAGENQQRSFESIALRVAKLLLKHSADPNVAGTEMRLTPLHVAARHGHVRLVEVLLAGGADANALDANGATPLHHAARALKAKCVRTLIAGGANPQLPDASGTLPRDVPEVANGKDSFASAIREHLTRHQQIYTEALEKKKAKEEKAKEKKEPKKGAAKQEL